ncbi:hypothetical protein [Bosea sp. ANAM02]|uniref:hypothetical protein n=1 Tax=Bosea sp. ANAM02 TaxID=2020412 RepID=UPI00140F2838|nr:hypothetical protein [Bosea sp. ANAM02]BCB22220.1 hypothetical protein OCUBac02_51140 [Bosea sp. ANAM02]
MEVRKIAHSRVGNNVFTGAASEDASKKASRAPKVKLGETLAAISDEERQTIFRALAVQYMLTAYEAMPTPVVVRAPKRDEGSPISQADMWYLGRCTLRWLLLNGYLSSTESRDAANVHQWKGEPQGWVGYDLMPTDKGIAAIQREFAFVKPEKRKMAIKFARDAVRQGLKGAGAKAIEGATLGGIGTISEIFSGMLGA